MQEISISGELMAILVCPETRLAVKTAPQSIIEQLNLKIAEGKLHNRAGKQVNQQIDAGLLREDSKVLYPVQDGIPIMLIEESIEVEGN